MTIRTTHYVAGAAALILFIPCALPAQSGATGAPPATPPARPADVSSVDAILAALYDVISGPAGQKRDWNRMRSLFIPGARLVPVRADSGGGSTAIVLDVDGFIERSGPFLEQGGFFEREIARRTERFGNIAHVFSTYETRRTLQDPVPFMRGINSIQLQRDGDRWWIVSVFWDAEREGNPLPSEYLPPG